MRRSHTPPLAVRRALEKLGADISAARRRRSITMETMAERAFVTRKTLLRVERGDPAVAMGTYATILFSLGMTERLRDLADPRSDALGLSLDEERLPQRVRPRRGGGA
jgi:transcriptional regulator with XRE-family HTH domain